MVVWVTLALPEVGRSGITAGAVPELEGEKVEGGWVVVEEEETEEEADEDEGGCEETGEGEPVTV